jgi:hypothetical protein
VQTQVLVATKHAFLWIESTTKKALGCSAVFNLMLLLMLMITNNNNFMQSPPQEDDSHSGDQEIPFLV